MSGDAAGCASSLESSIDVARLQQIFGRSLRRLTVSKNSRLADYSRCWQPHFRHI